MQTKKKVARCPQCNRAHDLKSLQDPDGTFICVYCGEEFDVKKDQN